MSTRNLSLIAVLLVTAGVGSVLTAAQSESAGKSDLRGDRTEDSAPTTVREDGPSPGTPIREDQATAPAAREEPKPARPAKQNRPWPPPAELIA